ncbi:MAG: hypothetical protein H7840_13180 [Alphaproteobacteria bacterium]
MMIANVEPSTPVALLYELAEKSYTISEVGATGSGLGTFVSLAPVGGATVAQQGAVVLNLQGTQQLPHLTGLLGQSVTFGPVPTVVGGTGKYVAFYPSAGVMGNGLGAGGYLYGHGSSSAMESHSAILKLGSSHSADHVLGHSGKAYTIVKTKGVAGGGSKLYLVEACDAAHKVKDILVVNVQNGTRETATLVGKTFTIGKAPATAGGAAGKYILLKPATGVAGKAAAGTALASQGMAGKGMAGKAAASAAPAGSTVTQGWWHHLFVKGVPPAAQTATQTAAQTATGGAAMAATKTAAAATAGKSAAAATGTIWSGTGLNLGLGLGLGAAGPLVVLGLAVATAYGLGQYRKKQRDIQAEA